MSFYEIFCLFIVGLGCGLCLAILLDHFEKKVLLRKTRIEGDHILQSAQDKAEVFFERQKKGWVAVNEKKLNVFEKEKGILNSNLRDIQSKIDKKAHQLKLKAKALNFDKNQKNIQQIHQTGKNIAKQKTQLQLELKQYIQNRIQKITNKFFINSTELKESLQKTIQENWVDQIRKNMDKQNEQNKQNLQKNAFFYLNMVLNRFDRAYCPERGIGAVVFKTKEQMQRVIGPNNIFLNQLEKECGVDILINQEDLQAVVFGIDPVRRELGRLSLTKLISRHKINTGYIRKTVKFSKKELFAKIRRDGDQICKKLQLKNVALEVKNMLGALRYRYSFAQNQYFHCEEVGWLCGLLNSEMNLPFKPAQRSGLFHDIGKAMDHSIDGNHAVIGAEFLSQYKESEDVLHAVRAHHHDVPPSTILAYLVIVADSISGSRPGARRFTEDSYNQKMASLERIIDSFENIEDAYIMSAGREMRVIVDPQKISDKSALSLSQQIARKIEKECSYPGLIKVTVVRHSEKTAIA